MTDSKPLILRMKPRSRPLPAAMAPRTRAASGPAGAARRRDGASVLVALIFIACWLLMHFVDTIWSEAVPHASLARAVVPCALGGILLLGARSAAAGSTRFGAWIYLLACVGVLSSVLSMAPLLGILKLALYLGILVPLCFSRSIRRAFAPESNGLFYLALAALALLVTSAVLFTQTGTGIYDNPNKLATLAVCAWPLMALQTRERGGFRQLLGWIGLLLCAIACVATFSRGGMVGLAAGVVTYLAVRYSPTFASLVSAAVIVAAIAATLILLNDRLRELAYKGRETIVDRTRQAMFVETIRAWSYRPLLGYGFGLSWTLDRTDAAQVLETGRMSWFTIEFGNSTLAMLSGGGAVIAVLFYGMIGIVMLRAFRSLADPRLSKPRREVQLVLFAGLVGMLAHAQVEAWLMAPLTWPTLIYWLYIVLAAELAAPYGGPKDA